MRITKKTPAAVLACTTLSAMALSLAGAPAADAATAGHWWNASPSKNECLAAPDDSTGVAIMWSCESDPGQNWSINLLGPLDGISGNPETFQIYDNAGCLEVPYAQYDSNGARVDVDQWCGQDGGSNSWYLEPAGTAGYYMLVNSMTDGSLCLSVAGGSLSSGAEVIQWSCHDTPDQEWQGAGI